MPIHCQTSHWEDFDALTDYDPVTICGDFCALNLPFSFSNALQDSVSSCSFNIRIMFACPALRQCSRIMNHQSRRFWIWSGLIVVAQTYIIKKCINQGIYKHAWTRVLLQRAFDFLSSHRFCKKTIIENYNQGSKFMELHRTSLGCFWKWSETSWEARNLREC